MGTLLQDVLYGLAHASHEAHIHDRGCPDAGLGRRSQHDHFQMPSAMQSVASSARRITETLLSRILTSSRGVALLCHARCSNRYNSNNYRSVLESLPCGL